MKPAVLMVLTVWGAQAAAVPLCLSRETPVDNFALIRAQAIVTRVFGDAGVRVEWLSERACKDAPPRTVRLILDALTPPNFGPAAMGYATPYGNGCEVHIFYRRIREDHRTEFAFVLGHAMAHEIAHVLQGLARHSEDGIMKALWSPSEYYEMQRGRLRFAREDVDLMHRGLERVTPATLVARN